MAPRGPGDGDPLGWSSSTLELDGDHPRIRCPRCRWRPRASERWACECGHVWNTFDTRGRCPACLYVWRVTQCLACHEISDHEAWYEERRQE